MSIMRRLINIVSENRWVGIGFSVRSDYLWPMSLMESKDPDQVENFNQWLDAQRSAQHTPSENALCILAMIIPTPQEIYVMWGQAKYIGQNQTHYQLRIDSGVHEYTKRNQIVFDSKESFEKFIIALRLKYEGENRKIDLKQMPVMETSTQSMKDLTEATDRDSVDDITSAFVSHYKEDPSGMFMHAKSSYLDAVGRAKDHSVKAAELHRRHSNMSKQEFQDTVMQYFGQHLKNHGFPEHASTEWGEAELDLLKSMMQDSLKEYLSEAKTPEEFLDQLRSLDKKPPRVTNTCPKCGKKWQLQHHCKGTPGKKDVSEDLLNELAPSPGFGGDDGEILDLKQIAEIIHSHIGDKFTMERTRDHRGKFNPNQPGYKFVPRDRSKHGMAKIWCVNDPYKVREYPTYNTNLYWFNKEEDGRVMAKGRYVENAVSKTRANAYRTAELILNHTAGALPADQSSLSEESDKTALPAGIEVLQLGKLIGYTTGKVDPNNPNRIEIQIQDSARRTWVYRDLVRLRRQ